MKQIIQDIKNGNTTLEDVPAPALKEGYVLIRTTRSLVSLGTERMLVSFGKAGWIGKARQQPERVKQVFDKIKTDGLMPTVNSVLNKLDKPIPLGYCNAGVVIGVGQNVTGFKVGDRVASNGHHAEIVSVPKNLVAKIPDGVGDEAASFTVAGAIALQGIRLVQPSFGETVVVLGLGLIGQITAQLLKANGCNVIGLDIDEKKLEIADEKNITAIRSGDNISETIVSRTHGIGVDAVIITVSSDDDEIISQAAKMCRKRGRIVLTGVTGLNLDRADFFEKELSFQVSCSYGPGRYDSNYEDKGNDYPIGYVRWTEQRNFEAVLQAMAEGKLDVQPLITARVPLAQYQQVYENLDDAKQIAAIIEYPGGDFTAQTVSYHKTTFAKGTGAIGIVGAGGFAQSVVLPTLAKLKANMRSIASENGLSASVQAKKYGIAQATTDDKTILKDPSIDTVFILTRHNQHASMAVEALKHGKHVFVEKPLALNEDELNNIIEAYGEAHTSITVGLNRRFAPFTEKIKSLLLAGSPVNIVMNVNAGAIPKEHWVNDIAKGGGRIIGEACHFIDLCTYLSGSLVQSVCTNAMNSEDDNVSILMQHVNGSNSVINYFANGNKAYDKERIEVYQAGRTLILENWRKLTGHGFSNFSSASGTQDKGHYNQFKKLLENIQKGAPSAIPFNEIINTTKTSFKIVESLRERRWVNVS